MQRTPSREAGYFGEKVFRWQTTAAQIRHCGSETQQI